MHRRLIVVALLALILALPAFVACEGRRVKTAPGNVVTATTRSATIGDVEWPDERPVTVRLMFAGVRSWKNAQGRRVSGIEVIVAPRDRYGHTVKRPGVIKIGLYALGPLVHLATREIVSWGPIPPMEANALWTDLTFSGYRLRCQWPQGRPTDVRRAEVKVSFTTRDGETIPQDGRVYVSFEE